MRIRFEARISIFRFDEICTGFENRLECHLKRKHLIVGQIELKKKKKKKKKKND